MKSIFFKFANTDQYNSKSKVIKWEDRSENRWENEYGNLNLRDRGYFLGTGKIYSGLLINIDKNISLTFDKIEEFDLSNDKFLSLEAIHPELNSRVKAHFHPFISDIEIKFSDFKKEFEKKEFINFWITKNSTLKTNFNSYRNGDRIIEITDEYIFKTLYILKDNKLEQFEDRIDLFNVKSRSINECILILEKSSSKKGFKKSTTAIQLKKIEQHLKKNNEYKFDSFSQYYNIIHNKKTYQNVNLKDKQYYVVGAYWTSSKPKDQTNRFIDENIWENGYDDKFQENVNSIPIGSLIAIKSTYKEADKMEIKCIGEVIENFKDGKTIEVNWDKEFKSFMVNYSGGYWETIKEVTKKDHIQDIFYHRRDVIESEDKSKKGLNQILFGPPGTGKTFFTKQLAVSIIEKNKNNNE